VKISTDIEKSDIKEPWGSKVYLDGRMVQNCIEADDKKGYIVKYIEEKGEILAVNTKFKYPEFATEKLYGKVEIKLPE